MKTGFIAKTFITERKALNISYLANKINWLPQNMNSWLKNRRGIPAEKLKLLENELAQYGVETY
jgi:hypothetical protein